MPTVSEIVQSVVDEIEQLDLVTPYRELTYQELLRLRLSGGSLPVGSVPFERSLVPVEMDGEGTDVPSESDSYAAAAQHLGVQRSTLESVFEIGDSRVQLAVPTNRVPEQKAEAARTFAICIAAVNDGLGRESRAAEVRMALDDYGRFDANNFMTALKKIPAELMTVKGRPNSKDQQLLIRRGGLEEAASLIRRLAGEA